MTRLESFPDRPLFKWEFERIRASEGVADAFVRFEVSEHDEDHPDHLPANAHIVQLVVSLERGRAVAAHYYPVPEFWTRFGPVHVDPHDPESIREAIELLDEHLEDARDGDTRYGEAVCVEIGLWEPERAEVYRRE